MKKIPSHAQPFAFIAGLTFVWLIYLTIKEVVDPEIAQYEWLVFGLCLPVIVIALGVTAIILLRGRRK